MTMPLKRTAIKKPVFALLNIIIPELIRSQSAVVVQITPNKVLEEHGTHFKKHWERGGETSLLPAQWFRNSHYSSQMTKDKISCLLLIHVTYNSCNSWCPIKIFQIKIYIQN